MPNAGLFAANGGIHNTMNFVTGSMPAHVVSLPFNSNTGTVLDRIGVDGILNGMVSLPLFP